MAETSSSAFRISNESLRQYDWGSLLEKDVSHTCSSFATKLGAEAIIRRDAGDDLGYRALSLLYTVASFRPNYDIPGNPYGPASASPDGGRSLLAEELADEDLAALKGIVADIGDPEFRARVADLLWECSRDFEAAKIAIPAFGESARRLELFENWPPFVDRLDRAMNLSGKRGFPGSLRSQTIAQVEESLQRAAANPGSGLLSARLMLLLHGHGVGDPGRYAILAEQLAGYFAKADDWNFAEEYWQVAERWFHRLHDAVQVKRCQLAAAECIVARSEKAGSGEKGSYGAAAHWMSRAVEALRRAGADPKRITEMHGRLLELQGLSRGELNPLEIDLSKIPNFSETERETQEAARAHISGHAFPDALGRFAHITNPVDAAATRGNVEKNAGNFIFNQLFATVAQDRAGKTADIAPPSGSGTPEAREEATRKQMLEQAVQVTWPMQALWKIEPARRVIIREHSVRIRDLAFLVSNNSFIPEGHELAYLRGIQAGFFGDWVVAIHLLVPQVEASVRHVLQQYGVVTSTLESDHTQKERDLNQLLWLPQTEDIFGPDFSFNLRGLLIERFGHNLRNESAHGLMPDGAFYQPAYVYLWWLVIRMCWAGRHGPQQPARSS